MLTPHASTATHWCVTSACRRAASVHSSQLCAEVASPIFLRHPAEVYSRAATAPAHKEPPITPAKQRWPAIEMAGQTRCLAA
jgi:hypothetical protein